MQENWNAQQAKRLLSTEEGQKLIKLLSQNGAMQQAGNALQQGDTRQAQKIMEPLMQNPEVQALLRTLEKTMNHG